MRVRLHRRGSRAPSILIIVQNLPVPFDRRVWAECQALRDAGYHVSVVCPKADGDPTHELIDGIELYKYRPRPAGTRQIGYLTEYGWSFAATVWLTVAAWRRHRFDVIQTCNPPDIFWPIGLLSRVAGTRFVFDQHDLCPELYQSRFAGRSDTSTASSASGLRYHGLRLLEWCTYRAADHVIATNASYRATAIGRGRKRPDQVTIVRTGPDPGRLRRQAPDPTLKRGRRFLVCYLGVMGPQDGVDLVLRAARVIRFDMGRDDVAFTLMGTGDCFGQLLELRRELGLEDCVELTGRAPDELVFRVLSTADIGLSPDPLNPLNDVSTMNKTMEYMAFELPVVAFDLRETRVSAEQAAVYVEPNDVGRYAAAIVDLLDDEVARRTMGVLGRARIEEHLAWRHQRGRYTGVYQALLNGGNGSNGGNGGNGNGGHQRAAGSTPRSASLAIDA